MVGVDVVDIERLRLAMDRQPGLEERLFTHEERTFCRAKADPMVHFAGTLAAKEAVIKAWRLGSLAAWGARVEIRREPTGRPTAGLRGSRPPSGIELSISHDGGVAVAVALALPLEVSATPSEQT
jgi:holo-[acyl-carrier protein] synthase